MESLDPVAKDVLDFWYGDGIRECYKRKWFSDMGTAHQNELDAEVMNRFGEVLKQAERGELSGWTNSPRGLLALVLVLDQFSRHIYRGTGDPQLNINDAAALSLSHQAVAFGWDQVLHAEELVFLFMPIRHSATIPALKDLLQTIDRWMAVEEERVELLQKFRKTTLNRLQHMEGQAGDVHDILEFHPFEADESDMPQSKVYKTVEAFLTAHHAHQYGAVMTSLSGGVDSMVLTKILTKLSPKFNHFKVIAAHIDYANRPESGAEAAFVEQWCAKHRVLFRKRCIDEIKRGVTARDEYEKESRRIRYDLYKAIMEEYKDDRIPAVMVGHHKGDVQENVISNMMKGCSLLDLAGMGTESIVNGVLIWRPLLPHPKSDIFDFSHKYGIPYFKDTTPKWSTRGKVRNQLLPLLKEIYGEGFLSHLSALAADSDQLHHITYSSLLQPFWDSVTVTDVGVYFDCKAYKTQPVLFWKEALKHVCHDMLGVGLISDKPIGMLLEALNTPGQESDTTGTWINLKKDFKSYLQGTTLFIFRREFFPKNPHFTDDVEISVGETVHLGPWTVELRQCENTTEPEALTVRDLFSGTIRYTLDYPGQYHITRLGKKGRPKVLRQINKSMTDPVPLVTDTKKELPQSDTVVQVVLTFKKNPLGSTH
eukprot:comp16043_c0_seq1/m.13527 comp16043_c0_seq1/g.13527  ORF comp16043_c0_seq1/g.13527 comp16043_c0_seq1/m.13527 type:complete len:652 (-) comp16043_c0_seq1:27-1982(-)